MSTHSESSYTSLPPPSSSSSSSFTIFTVSLSDSVVETCHSGLPKGRTLALPFRPVPKLTKTVSLKTFRSLRTRGAAGTELTQRVADLRSSLSAFIHTVHQIHVGTFGNGAYSLSCQEVIVTCIFKGIMKLISYVCLNIKDVNKGKQSAWFCLELTKRSIFSLPYRENTFF